MKVQTVSFCPEWFVVSKLVPKISEWDMCKAVCPIFFDVHEHLTMQRMTLCSWCRLESLTAV